MAEIILITGGARSGKSALALKIAESFTEEKVYVATSPVTDPEMAGRIGRHRQEREGRGWKTIEETTKLDSVIGSLHKNDVVVVDCLTLWINNLMYDNELLDEDNITKKCTELLNVCGKFSATIIFVTNEVGLGIVPANSAARKYRDLVGRCNQTIAAGADSVYLVSCGIPLQLKGEKIYEVA